MQVFCLHLVTGTHYPRLKSDLQVPCSILMFNMLGSDGVNSLAIRLKIRECIISRPADFCVYINISEGILQFMHDHDKPLIHWTFYGIDQFLGYTGQNKC